MTTTAEAKRGLFAKAATQPSFTIEQRGLFAPAPSWELTPGKRIPVYITKLVDGIVYKDLSIRLPAIEKYKPQYDMYRVTLPPKAEPHRHPIVEKRIPPFWRFKQITNTIATPKPGTFAITAPSPSYAVAKPGTFAVAYPALSYAKAKPGIFAPAA